MIPWKTKLPLYLQDDYLHYSQMIQNSSYSKCKKSLCAFPYYCTVYWLWTNKQTKKKKGWVHSFTQNVDRYFQNPPVWQLVGNDRQTTTRLQNKIKSQKQSGQKMRYTASLDSISACLKVCLWTTCKSILLQIGYCGINTAHVMVSMNTLQYNCKGRDTVSVFIRTYLQYMYYDVICPSSL